MSEQDLVSLIERQDKGWFTLSIKGNMDRYIVWLTHNNNVSAKRLKAQIKEYNILDNVNLWGWIDNETNKQYIDISTSCRSLDFAKKLGKLYKQIAIWDMETMSEVRI